MHITPRVAEVMRRSTSTGSMVKSSGPIASAKTGRPPANATALALATKLRDGTMTSMSGPTPSAMQARCSAAVPLESKTDCRAPENAANSRSNAVTSAPSVSQPLSITPTTAFRSSEPRSRSESGICQAVMSQPQTGTQGLELLVRLRKVVRPTKVEPVVRMHVSIDVPPAGEQRLNQIGKVHAVSGRYQLDYGALYCINPHAHEVMMHWFFVVLRDASIVICLDDAEFITLGPAERAYRQFGPAVYMRIE